MLAKVFDEVKHSCLIQPKVGMHRDYHSRNLMLLENDEIGVIDFQEGLQNNINWFSNHWDLIQETADFPIGMSSAVRK